MSRRVVYTSEKGKPGNSKEATQLASVPASSASDGTRQVVDSDHINHTDQVKSGNPGT